MPIRLDTYTSGLFFIIRPILEEGEIFDSGMLREQVAQLVKQGQRNIALDLSQLTYLYSDAMNAMFALNRQILDVNGRLALLAPTEEVAQILQSAGIYNFIKVYHTVEELVRSSEDIIMQTSSFDASALRKAAAPKSEFEDLRSEIEMAMDGKAGLTPPPAPSPLPHAPAPRPPVRPPARPQPPQPQYEEPAVVPPPPSAPAAPPPIRPVRSAFPAPGTIEMAPAAEVHGKFSVREEEEEFEDKKKSPWLVVTVVAVLIVVGLSAAAFFLAPKFLQKPTPSQTTAPAVPKPAEAAAQLPVETTAPPETAANALPATPAPALQPAPTPEPAKPRDVFAEKKAPMREPKPAPRPAPPAPAPPAASAQVNRLVITSTPTGAQVAIDGVAKGTTPYTWSNPNVIGNVSITVSKPGYVSSTENIDYDGGVKQYSVKLDREPPPPPPPKPEPAPVATSAPAPAPAPTPAPTPAAPASSGESGKAATVFISSIPPVADVYMDGVLIGKTNISKLNVASGTHTMKFVKGAKEHTVEMSFQPGDNPAKHVTF